MQIHVLGSAAGGGVPQWNCGCPNCEGARTGRLPRRMQASIAASADGHSWILFNASTDIRLQLDRVDALRPHGRRGSPIEAVYLTDANIDHAAGLLDFRQAGRWRVVSTTAVRETLVADRMFAPFASAPRHWDACDAGTTDAAGLRVTAIPVPGLLPSYAGGGARDGAACAYAIQDSSGRRVVYAPIYSAVPAALRTAIDGADTAFLDGSFFTDDEMIALGLGSRTARDMGHEPIDGAGGSLEALRGARCVKKLFTHVNNSNPALDPASPSAARIAEAGFSLAEDGMTLVFPEPSPQGETLARPH
jgi:pyrroloquinoline quinone biosynthesis protein B